MRNIALSLLLLATALSRDAQTFDASQWTLGVTTISSLLRFHPGDNPAWASPSFDDTSWPLLKDRPWGRQGYPGLTGYCSTGWEHSRSNCGPRILRADTGGRRFFWFSRRPIWKQHGNQPRDS